jgi:hypothetical protein
MSPVPCPFDDLGLFPAAGRSRDPRSGIERRHHLPEQSIQRSFRRAVQKAGLAKAATCHTLRHSFATPPPDERIRHPHGAGAAGSPEREDDDDLHPCAEPWRSWSAEPAGPVVMNKRRGLSAHIEPPSLPRRCVASRCLVCHERDGATPPYRPMINCISFHAPCGEHTYRLERIPYLGGKPLRFKEMSKSGFLDRQESPDLQEEWPSSCLGGLD